MTEAASYVARRVWSFAGWLTIRALREGLPSAPALRPPARAPSVVSPELEQHVETVQRVTRSAIIGTICVALAVAVFVFILVRAETVPAISAQDEGALLYGAHQLLETGSVRVDNELAREYGSPVIGNLYASYQSDGEGHYRAFPGMILVDAALIGIGGDGFFWASNAVFSMAAVIAVFFLTWRVTRSTLASAFAAVIFGTSPVFLHWGTGYFNNVPVIAAELAALACVVGPRGRVRETALGGVFMGLACFVRTTEVFTAVIFLAFVIARHRDLRAIAAAALPIVIAGTALATVNLLLYGNATYQPHIAPTFPALGAGAADGPGIIERQLMFLVGAEGSLKDADLGALPGHYLFHLQFFVRSSFAFPLLLPILAVAIFGAARAWTELRAIAVLAAATLLLTTFLYGNNESNYYGYGESIVRNSFVRYTLLTYALVAVIGGIALARLVRAVQPHQTRGLLASGVAIGLIAASGFLGLQQADDWDRYGLSRFNLYRTASVTQTEQLEEVIGAHRQDAPLVLVGFTTGKLVDLTAYPNVIDYSELPAEYRRSELPELLERVLEDRPVFVVASRAAGDQELIQHLRDQGFTIDEHKLEYDAVYRVRPAT